LKRDGTVVAWGLDRSRQATPPAGLSGVVAVAAGASHSLAVRQDGTVVGWGTASAATPPVGLSGVTAVAAGDVFSLGLRHDGTVVGWGGNDSGQASPPAGLSGVTAIAAGGRFALALRSHAAPTLSGTPVDGALGQPYSFAYTVTGFPTPMVSVTSGSLPPGLTLSGAGVISGIPAALGSHAFILSATNIAGAVELGSGMRVRYGFGGFRQPVDDPPAVNAVNAGGVVPLTFSLGIDAGLDIFAEPGAPTFQTRSCATGTPVGAAVIVPTSTLTYRPANRTYSLMWKTSKADEGRCGTLSLNLKDGSAHTAEFRLR
jgi:hypothetical protein